MFVKPVQRLYQSYKTQIYNQNRLLRAAKNHEEIKAETKILKVAIIGCPNAGKSTLINNIIDRKICPTSEKVHTTRKKSVAIFTEGDSQIIFIDTPGLVGFSEFKRYNLEKNFLKDCKSGLEEADVIGVLHDVGNPWTKDLLDMKVIRLLEKHQEKHSFLIFNKVDLLRSKRELLDLTRSVTDNCLDGKPIQGTEQKSQKDRIKGWPHFKDIFMVSALSGSGLEDIKSYLVSHAKPGPWKYPEDVYSDQTPENIIITSVKATLLDFLPQEIPYQLVCKLELFETNEEGVIIASIVIHCPSERIAQLVGGVSDGRLRQITEVVQQNLQSAFQTYVRVRLVLEHPKNK